MSSAWISCCALATNPCGGEKQPEVARGPGVSAVVQSHGDPGGLKAGVQQLNWRLEPPAATPKGRLLAGQGAPLTPPGHIGGAGGRVPSTSGGVGLTGYGEAEEANG